MSKAISVQCTAIPGGTVCRYHGGGAQQVKAKAAVRAELLGWGLRDTTVDPGEVLLRLVTQSAARAERYAMLLEEAYEAAERLKQAHDAGAEIDSASARTLVIIARELAESRSPDERHASVQLESIAYEPRRQLSDTLDFARKGLQPS